MLVESVYVFLSPLDLRLSWLASIEWRRVAAGFEGAGVVRARGVGAEVQEGRCVVQVRVGRGTVPGFDIDGWLATLHSKPLDALSAVSRCEPWHALLYSTGVGAAAAKAAGGLAVLGCGVSGLAAALTASDEGFEARLYCVSRGGLRVASRLGLQAKLLRNTDPEELADNVYLSTIDPAAVMLVEKARPRLLLLHPAYEVLTPPAVTDTCTRVVREAEPERGARIARLMLDEGVVRETRFDELGVYDGSLLVVRVAAREEG